MLTRGVSERMNERANERANVGEKFRGNLKRISPVVSSLVGPGRQTNCGPVQRRFNGSWITAEAVVLVMVLRGRETGECEAPEV